MRFTAILALSLALPSGGSLDAQLLRARAPRLEPTAPAASATPRPAQGRPSQPGNPLLGISADEFELFTIGLQDFLEMEEAGEGLGPVFNGLGCAQCHATPAIGGISPVAEVRIGRLDEDGEFYVMGGDTLYHLFALPNQECQPAIPKEANVIARRIPIPLFGAGLVEAIHDESIAALEDPDDANGDGISGRAAWIEDAATGTMRVGRFGWKSQHATLLAFAADAYRNEMGITNDLFRNEVGAGIHPDALRLCDPKPDPEDRRDPLTGLRGIDAFEGFMRFLAPIEREAPSTEAARGEAVFSQIGCGSCHTPLLMTGANRNPLFDRRPVPLYSDLLLHDVGTGDGIVQAAARANEIRTPALWGLRFRRPLLHDGAAATHDEAVLRHTGEAKGAAQRYRDLAPDERRALLAFLDSL
jgi:CxxC motif-containing protein (DUF1111 family)